MSENNFYVSSSLANVIEKMITEAKRRAILLRGPAGTADLLPALKGKAFVCNPSNLIIFLTSNDTREFSEPLLRRVVSITLSPLPSEKVYELLHLIMVPSLNGVRFAVKEYPERLIVIMAVSALIAGAEFDKYMYRAVLELLKMITEVQLSYRFILFTTPWGFWYRARPRCSAWPLSGSRGKTLRLAFSTSLSMSPAFPTTVF